MWGYVRTDVASNATSAWAVGRGRKVPDIVSSLNSNAHALEPQQRGGPLFASVSAVNIKCTDYIEKVDFWWKETVGIRVALGVQSICVAGSCTRPVLIKTPRAEQMETNTVLIVVHGVPLEEFRQPLMRFKCLIVTTRCDYKKHVT
jgi:hypothetical protein